MRAVIRSLSVITAVAALLGACATQPTPPAAAAVAVASAAPAPVVDPYLAQRPTSASVGVPQPENFQPAGWMNNNWIEQVTQMSSLPSTPGGVAFVGDSITNGFRWAEAFPNANVRNWGISGDTTWGVLARSQQIIATKPAKIFLLIGTNDFGNWGKTPEETAAGVAAIVDLWKAELPGTQIYLQGVMPRQPEYRDRVTTLNAMIQRIATEKGATYVDLYTPFLAGDRLDPTVTMDDLHLTGQGYQRWLSIITPCVTGAGPCA
jgi:lysophospholipase L1-like esterase